MVIFLRIFEASLYDRYNHFFQMNLRYKKVNNVPKVTLLLNDWSSNPHFLTPMLDILPMDCNISYKGNLNSLLYDVTFMEIHTLTITYLPNLIEVLVFIYGQSFSHLCRLN